MSDTMGLSIKESKCILSGIQEIMIPYQVKSYVETQRQCLCCHSKRLIKGYHTLVYRTLFGKLRIQSPQLYACKCQKGKSYSPLANLLSERTAPELSYMQSKWASLMSMDCLLIYFMMCYH